MRNHHQSNGPVRDPYSVQLNFSAAELAGALGCAGNDIYQLKAALYSFCKQCVIRFGLPDQCRTSLGDALGLPNNQHLRYPPRGAPVDPRWARIAQALELPAPGNLPIISLRVASDEELTTIRQEVRALVQELQSQNMKPIAPNIAEALRDKWERVRSWGEKENEGVRKITHPLALAAYRQLQICHEVGAEWTLVVPEERLVLTGCTLPARPAKPTSCLTDRMNRETIPAPELLRPFGLIWFWKEARNSWEPRFPLTKKTNSSLFDQSSIYLERETKRFALERAKKVPTTRNAETIKLLGALKELRREFEFARKKTPNNENALLKTLHVRQNRTLSMFINKNTRPEGTL